MDSAQFKPKTLAQVAEALDAVEKARVKKGLTASDKMALQNAALTLRSIERSIEKTIQDELVESLTIDTSKLNDLVDAINTSSKKLDKLAVVLKKTAEVVDAFVKIIVTAVGVGLL